MGSLEAALDAIALDLQDGLFLDNNEVLALAQDQHQDPKQLLPAHTSSFGSLQGTELLLARLEQAFTRFHVSHQSKLAQLSTATSNNETLYESQKTMLTASSYDMIYEFVREMPSIAAGPEEIEDPDDEELEQSALNSDPVTRVSARTFQRRMQDVFCEIQELDRQKLSAYRKLQCIMNTHGRMLGAYAQSCGVHESASIARKIVQASSASLLSIPFFDSQPLINLKQHVTSVYAAVLCNGHEELANTELSSQKIGQVTSSPKEFGLGVRVGLGAVLLLWAVSESVELERYGNIWMEPTLRIFRAIGDLLLLMWLWGLSLWVWEAYGVDYSTLLELPPPAWAQHPSQSVWREASNLSIVYLKAFIVFCKVLRGEWSLGLEQRERLSNAIPVALFLWFVYRCVAPWKERVKQLSMLGRVYMAPYYDVTFRDGFIGDILTSTVRVSIDLAFAAIYTMKFFLGWITNNGDSMDDKFVEAGSFQFLIVPTLIAMPLWIRYIQNIRRCWDSKQRWPHLGNALKYASAMTLVLFAVFRPEFHNLSIWITLFVGATLYQFWWDIFMDWDLVRLNRFGMPYLREGIYGSEQLYMTIIVINFALRFLWTATLLPQNTQNVVSWFLQRYMSSFIAAAEIIRRIMWGFLRLENEQLQSTGTVLTSSSKVRESSTLSPMDIDTSHPRHTKPAPSASKFNKSGYRSLGSGSGLPWHWSEVMDSRALIESVGLTVFVVVLMMVAAAPGVGHWI